MPDESAVWFALFIDALALGILGWLAVAKWTRHFWLRLASALVTAAFGGVLIGMKAFLHH